MFILKGKLKLIHLIGKNLLNSLIILGKILINLLIYTLK